MVNTNNTCPRCSIAFETQRSWQVYCSERCRRNMHRASRRASRKTVRYPIKCAQCSSEFTPTQARSRFCSDPCRNRAHQARKRADHKPRFRNLRCKWCRGPHRTDLCTNRSGNGIVRQFGTLGADREYIPPPGVHVRVISVPSTIHGDSITRLMQELES